MKTLARSTFSFNRPATKIVFKNLIKLGIAGTLIGFFFPFDLGVAVLLASYLVYTLIKKWRRGAKDRKIYLIGAVTTGILGVICELWGIHNGYWEYHQLAGGREFPFWLPFAWALAFTYLYKLEKGIITTTGVDNMTSKMILAPIIAMIFPTLGEMITINLGVWTYQWPLQIMGVPLLAIILLTVFHTGVNLIMTWICQRNNWKNPVFNP
ncbi:hypothetical protein [Negadavirga shengliensis]|uniref:Uncharacterized protein n=1 Tax=Negadavirga shengliensis TaxID=1389218 RepID=A0ABV9T3M7_9BACT